MQPSRGAIALTVLLSCLAASLLQAAPPPSRPVAPGVPLGDAASLQLGAALATLARDAAARGLGE